MNDLMNRGYWNKFFIGCLERTLAEDKAKYARSRKFKDYERMVKNCIEDCRNEYDATVSLIEGITNPVQREVYTLHYLEGKTYEQIAEILHYSVKQVNLYGNRPIE